MKDFLSLKVVKLMSSLALTSMCPGKMNSRLVKLF
jgi:hypothetical protein